MNAVDVLKYGHQTVLDNIAGLPNPDWLTPGVCGVWSVKDIIAHLASFEHMLIEVLSTFSSKGPTPILEKRAALGDAFNDVEVASRKDRPVAEVLAEYEDAQAETMVLIRQIPVETIRRSGSMPWYGDEYALDDFIVYTYYGHKREHCAQIAVYRDSLRGR